MSRHFIGTLSNLALFTFWLARGELLAATCALAFTSVCAFFACAAETADERRAAAAATGEAESTRHERERWERTWANTKRRMEIAGASWTTRRTTATDKDNHR